MFSDDSDSHEDSDKDDELVKYRGSRDTSLTYGIQFIMNALKSWAQSRLYNEYNQGRLQVADPNDPWDLSKTNEGKAIAAFRRVVESGCLQVNTILPEELSSALRRLYVQIDVLINQTTKPEPQWVPMAYGPQIRAHEVKLERHLEHQARLQQEIQNQQQLADRRMAQQMSVPQQPNGQMMPRGQGYGVEPLLNDIYDPRRRSSSHRQNVPNQYGPPQQGAPQQGPPPQFGPPPPGYATYGGVPYQYPQQMHNTPPQFPAPKAGGRRPPANGGSNVLDNSQMFAVPLERSGAQMVRSFLPPLPPLPAAGGNIVAHAQNAAVHASTNPSVPNGTSAPINRNGNDGHAHPNNATRPSGSFTAVNSTSRGSESSPISIPEPSSATRTRKKRKTASGGVASATGQ
jgi:hypothetical protein